MASLAKRFEEVFVPGQADPIRLPRQSEALYLLQRIRDESHRFAITYHRELRGQAHDHARCSTASPASGPTRRKRLVKELGGVKAVKEASLEDLKALHVAARPGGRGRLRASIHRPDPAGRLAVTATTSGRRTPAGGRTASPRAPTPSTSSRSCRWPPRRSPGAGPVLDVGTGEGQVARLAVAARRRRPSSASTRPRPRSSRPRRRGGGRPTPRAGAAALPFARRRRSTRSWPASSSSTSPTSTPRSAEVARVLRPAAGSPSSSTTRCCRRRTAAGSTTRSSTRPSSTGASGPTCVEDLTLEEVEKGVLHPLRPPAAQPLRQRAWPPHGLVLRRMEEPAPPPGLPRPGAEYPEAAPTTRACSCCVTEKVAGLAPCERQRSDDLPPYVPLPATARWPTRRCGSATTGPIGLRPVRGGGRPPRVPPLPGAVPAGARRRGAGRRPGHWWPRGPRRLALLAPAAAGGARASCGEQPRADPVLARSRQIGATTVLLAAACGAALRSATSTTRATRWSGGRRRLRRDLRRRQPAAGVPATA